MKFSTIMRWTVIAIASALFASEAYAQLPVRTRSLQLLGTGNNTAITMQATGNVTAYTIEWPLADGAATGVNTPFVVGDSGYVKARMTAAGTMRLEWEKANIIDGKGNVDGGGNEIAYFTDQNTLASDPTFRFDANGKVMIGGGVTGAAAGLLEVQTAAGAVNAAIAGETGTLTLGGATSGSLVMNDGSANTITIATGNQANNATIQVDGLPAGTYTVTPSTNAAGAATASYIYVSNGDGTATWTANPNRYYKSGRQAVTAGYSHTVTFPVAFAAPVTATDITVTANLLSGNGTIIEITDVTLTGFTIQSTAPMVGTETIMWAANANP
ncbi:MAG: hypothetical protein FGM24_02620 [Candidatus Kapabacteria bacterium]|nr:hypothetical protein [Candidatus Kapabacteria bacterium]